MALWEEKDYGVLADRACWSMFAITAGECFVLGRPSRVEQRS